MKSKYNFYKNETQKMCDPTLLPMGMSSTENEPK